VTALATLAAASRAQRIDCLARAATPWARRHVHKASEHRLLDLTHLAAPIAGAAGRDLGAGLRAAALAALARLEPRDADRARAALHRVDELDLDLHAQVGAAHRSPRLAPAELATKERLEEIADAEVSETLTVAEHVVALAPLRVGKHLVRLGDRLEALAPIGGLARVGVVLAREPPVRAADLIRRLGARHAQQLVVVDAGPSHQCHYPGSWVIFSVSRRSSCTSSPASSGSAAASTRFSSSFLASWRLPPLRADRSPRSWHRDRSSTSSGSRSSRS